MIDALAPIAYALFLWWFSTGVIFYLNGRSPTTFRWSFGLGTVVCALALAGLAASADDRSALGAYCAFTSGVLIWGWQTMSYYMGFITGPMRGPCPPDATGWRRFRLAVRASLYHELVIAATALLIAWITWGQPNRFGLWTFLALWAMHVSAKLNVFLGVRNLGEEFLPAHLDYLRSFFRRRWMNPLFPFSVTAGTAATVMVAEAALAPAAGAHASAGYVLLATLLGLAVLEHWVLVLPVPFAALWRWSLRGKAGPGPAGDQQPERGMEQRSTPFATPTPRSGT